MPHARASKATSPRLSFLVGKINKSKLLIHTSQFETFGLVAIEANTMGIPVLTTNNGSLMEIIENNKRYLDEGGHFIICFPEIKIIGKK